MQNFRSLGPIFLVEVEVEVGGGVNSHNRVQPNQVKVRLSCG